MRIESLPGTSHEVNHSLDEVQSRIRVENQSIDDSRTFELDLKSTPMMIQGSSSPRLAMTFGAHK